MIESYKVDGRRVADGAFNIDSETFLCIPEGGGPEIKDYLLELQVRHRNGMTCVVLDITPYTQDAQRAFLHVCWPRLLGSLDTQVHAHPGCVIQLQQVVSRIAMQVDTLDHLLKWRETLVKNIGHALCECLVRLGITDCTSV